jgi:SNF family Na+-dependent transporter
MVFHTKERTQTAGVQEYWNLRHKWQEGGEDYIIKSFIICTFYETLLGWSDQEGRDG